MLCGRSIFGANSDEEAENGRLLKGRLVEIGRIDEKVDDARLALLFRFD